MIFLFACKFNRNVWFAWFNEDFTRIFHKTILKTILDHACCVVCRVIMFLKGDCYRMTLICGYMPIVHLGQPVF